MSTPNTDSDDTLPVDLVRRHPTVTNPHIRMCAVITEVLRRWGSDGERVLRDAYRELGHRTGEYMIATGVVARGADIETYGRVSGQIMDACGLDGWRRIASGPDEHRTAVPNCADYVAQYTAMNAPLNLCPIPFEWDNGCLDVINLELRIAPETCAYRGDSECHYVIRNRVIRKRVIRESVIRESVIRASPAGVGVTPPVRTTSATALSDAPAWTNPQAGLLTILARSLARLSPTPYPALLEAMRGSGAETGRYLLDGGLLPANAAPLQLARTAAAIAEVSGYGDLRVTQTQDGARLVGTNPFTVVLDAFGFAGEVSNIVQEWENRWVNAVNPAVRVLIEQDGLNGGDRDQRSFIHT